MTRAEAKRFAHKLVADVMQNEAGTTSASDWPWLAGQDALEILSAVRAIVEHHQRYGPKSTDRAPREPEADPHPMLPGITEQIAEHGIFADAPPAVVVSRVTFDEPINMTQGDELRLQLADDKGES